MVTLTPRRLARGSCQHVNTGMQRLAGTRGQPRAEILASWRVRVPLNTDFDFETCVLVSEHGNCKNAVWFCVKYSVSGLRYMYPNFTDRNVPGVQGIDSC